MTHTRREFLWKSGRGLIASAAVIKGLDSLFLTNALAQAAADDYKALVCVFLFGGNDSNNIVIPITNPNRQAYDDARGDNVMLALTLADLANTHITPPSDPANEYALHPQLNTGAYGGLYQLWNTGNAGIVVNTGTIIDPSTSKDQLRQGINRPYQLFSHSDQQSAWQTSSSTGPYPTGWGGRIADRVRGLQTFPVVSSIAGVQVFTQGSLTRPLIVSPAPTRLDQLLTINRTSDTDGLSQIVAFDRGDGNAQLVKASANLVADTLNFRAQLIAAGDDQPVTPFPPTSLGNQLKQVAKLIKAGQGGLAGITRQIFFVSIGGFDTHNNQGRVGGTQGNLWLQVSEAIAALYQETVALNVANNVTTFTCSDFSRTLKPANPGGQVGTDHAWGSHQFVVGGAVKGGDFYGTYPSLELGGNSDYDVGSGARGRWIPTQSVDQFGYTLANWYGVLPEDLPYVFPNIGRFSPPDLGFMTAPTGAASRSRARKSKK